MNLGFNVLLLHVLATLHISFLIAVPQKQINGLDEQAVVCRANTIKKAFDNAIASDETKKFTANLINDLYGLYQQFFNETKKHYSAKDVPAVKQYLLIIKDAVQKLELAFTQNKGTLDVEKLAGIIALSAFKIKLLEESNIALANCIDQATSSSTITAPLYRIVRDIVNLFIVIAEHAKKHLKEEDSKMLKLTENLVTMYNIANLFDGNLKANLIKAHLWGPKVSQHAIIKVVLFWAALAPSGLSLATQILDQHMVTIMHTCAAMTDGFIAQLNGK